MNKTKAIPDRLSPSHDYEEEFKLERTKSDKSERTRSERSDKKRSSEEKAIKVDHFKLENGDYNEKNDKMDTSER